ncbi:MAG: hypothetical protein ACOYMR_15565 [Ilumatobacteraceae bacterium]
MVRSISTVDDVRAILSSLKCSFVELMDCVRVAHAASDWQLRRAAAERAFEMATSSRSSSSLVDAANAVACSILLLAGSLDDLGPRTREASAWLRSASDEHDSLRLLASERCALLDEVLLLLSDEDPQSLVRLSSRLRKLQCPERAVDAASAALRAEPRSPHVLVTLAAGLADCQRFGPAKERILDALAIQPGSPEALTTASRIYQEMGDLRSSLSHAEDAFSARPDQFTAHRLLKVAGATRDQSAIDRALEVVEANLHTEDSTDLWLLALTTEVLAASGDIAAAERNLAELSKHPLSGALAKMTLRCKDLVRAAKRPALFDPTTTS